MRGKIVFLLFLLSTQCNAQTVEKSFSALMYKMDSVIVINNDQSIRVRYVTGIRDDENEIRSLDVILNDSVSTTMQIPSPEDVKNFNIDSIKYCDDGYLVVSTSYGGGFFLYKSDLYFSIEIDDLYLCQIVTVFTHILSEEVPFRSIKITDWI